MLNRQGVKSKVALIAERAVAILKDIGGMLGSRRAESVIQYGSVGSERRHATESAATRSRPNAPRRIFSLGT